MDPHLPNPQSPLPLPIPTPPILDMGRDSPKSRFGFLSFLLLYGFAALFGVAMSQTVHERLFGRIGDESVLFCFFLGAFVMTIVATVLYFTKLRHLGTLPRFAWAIDLGWPASLLGYPIMFAVSGIF